MNDSVLPPAPEREAALFAQAIEKPAAERATFLQAACGSDNALRARLEVLLAAHVQPGGWMNEEVDEPSLQTLKIGLAEEAPDEVVGETIGRYKLLEKVGEGGCGVVYVAEQTEPVRRRVALKVIKLGMDTKDVIARFEAERQALALMDHPNIAKVLDAGTTDLGRPYFVMELVRGIRITDYCDQAQLPTNQRLDLFIKVCQAIQHAHQKGIIHRDIKPSNILVTLHDGVPVPKVIDFGIAKATEGRLTEATVYTQLHQFIGTPAYMSPEQAEMSGLDIDTRSDIYSLGVLLYELLAGSTPFDGRELLASGIDAMRKTIREKEPPRPSTRVATLGAEQLTTTAKRRSADTSKLLHQLRGDLDWIVMKCLEKDRTRRYETANGLAADLKRHLNNEPVVARPPSTAYRFQKAFRRNKLVFTAAAAVAATLLIGIAVSSWQTFAARKAQRETDAARTAEQKQRVDAQQKQAEAEAQRQRAETEQQRADAESRKATESQQKSRRLLYAADMNLAQQSLKLNNLGRARRLLDRHRPQPSEEDLRGWEWRYLWQLTRSTALITLTNRAQRGFDVSFSPDGTRLAAAWFDGRVEVWDVRGQRWLRALAKGGQPHQGHVAFSARGNVLVATAGPGTVAIHDLDSGRESILWQASDTNGWAVRDLSFSSNGTEVVIYAGSIRSDPDVVWVVNASTSAIQSRHVTLHSGEQHHGAARLSPDGRRLYLARSEAAASRYRIQCLERTSGQEVWQTEEHRDVGLTALAVSPDGRVLASASGYEDPAIRIWEAATGRLLRELDGHTAWVCELTFSRDGKHLVSASTDQSIRFWDTDAWSETKVLRGHTDEIHAVAVSEAAQLVASASKNGDLLLWSNDEESHMDGYRRLAADLGRNGVATLDQSKVLLFPPGRAPEIADLQQSFPAQSLSGLGSSMEILGCFETNILCVWNGTNQAIIGELDGASFVPRHHLPLKSDKRPVGFAYQATDQMVAWTDRAWPESVFLASLEAPDRRTELHTDIPRANRLQFSQNGALLIAWAFEQGLRVWDVKTGKNLASVEGLTRAADVAANGRVLVVILARNHDHEVAFYDLSNPGREPRRIPAKHFGYALAVSPDGALVATTGGGGEVRLYDPAKGELTAVLHGHLHATFGVTFSADGRRLVSLSGGREAAKLWDVDTRQELLTLSGTGSFLPRGTWSADGDTLVGGSPWQAWRAPTWEEIAAAEAKALSKQP